MQQGLIIPDLGVELVAFEVEHRFGKFKALVAADLEGGAQWQQKLKG